MRTNRKPPMRSTPHKSSLRNLRPSADAAAQRAYQFDLKILRQFPPKGKYLIGVSGGRDSVVLLHQLLNSGYKRLVVCHLNHRLRGKQSAADARFVEKLAQQNGLHFELGSVKVPALAQQE